MYNDLSTKDVCQLTPSAAYGYVHNGAGIFLICLLFSYCQEPAAPPLFLALDREVSGIDFINKLAEDDSFNIIEYLYFYNGGGVAVADFNNDGYPDIYFSANQLPNRLYLNMSKHKKNSTHFRDVSEISGIKGSGNWSTGVSVVDINADGWLDIYQCNVGNYKHFKGKNELFINQGCANHIASEHVCEITFTEASATYGLDFSGFSTQAAWLDYDLDGDLDMYLLRHSVHSTESYRDTSATRKHDVLAGDRFYENQGIHRKGDTAKFKDVTQEVGIHSGLAGYGLGIGVSDIDGNGYPDLYVGNDFHENDFLYLNQGDKSFKEVGVEALGHTSYFSMGNDLADINNDGLTDIITLDMKPDEEVLFKQAQGPDPFDIYQFKRSFGYHHQLPANALQINQGLNHSGTPVFSEQAEAHAVSATDWSWSVLNLDMDLDGWKDLFITNGIPRRPNNLDYLKYISNRTIQERASDLDLAAQMPPGRVSNRAFRRSADGNYTEATRQWGLEKPSISHGAAYADFDRDGDLDLIVNNLNEPAFLFENQANQRHDRHFIALTLIGDDVNPMAIGTKVNLYAGKLKQQQELYTIRGWQSSVEPVIIFGIDTIETVDSIVIRYPGRSPLILRDMAIDQYHTVDISASTQHIEKPKKVQRRARSKSYFLPAYKHQENDFSDYYREPLIPYFISTQGPNITVGDFNGDQLEDFHIGGASGQSGMVFFQQATGTWEQTDQPALEADREMEDTGGACFDADQDGDLDIFVASGGNEFYREDARLLDRLYLNDGSGNFHRSPSLPDLFQQTSCVRPFDFDADGDQDIFLGSRSIPMSYGKRPSSHLLINDGSGSFHLAETTTIDLQNLGMVTDAQWGDIDADGDVDLLIVGDWMPLKIYEQQQGHYKQMCPLDDGACAPVEGWWNSLSLADLDGDNDLDVVMGNLGTNNHLKVTIDAPLRMYRADFDQNLTPDPILTHVRHGSEYPLFGLDALANQLVFLKKKYRSYDQFAMQSIQDIFSETQLSMAEVSIVRTLKTVVAINQGEYNFSWRPLPMEAQMSPVHAILSGDFTGDRHADLLLAGNFFEMHPLIGRPDAQSMVLLAGNGEGGFKSVKPDQHNFHATGQIRDMKVIQGVNEQFILAARNNDSLAIIPLKAGI